MMSNRREEVWQSLEDPDYRRDWADEHVGVGLAFQIRALREKHGFTQAELGARIGRPQGLLSQWENPNYGRYALRTLKELAAAFDVGLLVRFVPFGELIHWTADLTHDRIAPPDFATERAAVINPPQSVVTAVTAEAPLNRWSVATSTGPASAPLAVTTTSGCLSVTTSRDSIENDAMILDLEAYRARSDASSLYGLGLRTEEEDYIAG